MESTVELGEPLRRTLRLAWDPPTGIALTASVDTLRGHRPVLVTQLADPRSGYYRLRHPIPATPEAEERLGRGRRRHEEIERQLAPPERCELRVARDGIVGRVDLVTDRPVELKTTAAAVPREHLLADRSGYFEQLGMYCALADVAEGRLLVVAEPVSGGPTEVEVIDCHFADLPEMRRGMAEAADRFRDALARNDPGLLPRCPWFDRGCGYQHAGVCRCTGSEPNESLAVARHLDQSGPNETVRAEVLEKLGQPPPLDGAARLRAYRGLVYLRRGYFEELRPDVERIVPSNAEAASEGPGLYQLLREAVEARSPPGIGAEPQPSDAPEEKILRINGDPAVLKTSRALGPPRIEEFPDRYPWYFLELGFRCAAMGRDAGWLVLGYERLRPWEAPVRVLRVRFDPILPWQQEFATRQARLRAALAAGAPTGLPACPEWMREDCPFQPECGEGELPACRRTR